MLGRRMHTRVYNILPEAERHTILESVLDELGSTDLCDALVPVLGDGSCMDLSSCDVVGWGLPSGSPNRNEQRDDGMQALDPLQLSLDGMRLIEASAGTGKTYTIAALYLRLLLETQRDIEEILVVTFTQAATEELRERIGKRLRDARAVLEGGDCQDPLLAGLLDRLADREAASQQLRDALTRLDEAAIFTIHGFCQRMLQENAFESGVLFEAEFITSEQELRHTIIQDFWRRQFYGAALEEAQWIRSQWSGPDALLAGLADFLKHRDLVIVPEVSPRELERGINARAALLRQLRTIWERDSGTVQDILSTGKGLSRAASAYRADRVALAREALEGFLASPDGGYALSEGFALFTAQKIAASLKKNAAAPEHPFFDACQAFQDGHERLQTLRRIRILREAIEYMQAELVVRKGRQRLLSFDDLLHYLDRALDGEDGRTLAGRMRSRYPVALIDEFQDTDPLQYGIFRRVYQGNEGCGLFLIGDPKQAIYSFRGADIFTYMQARRDTDPQTGRFTLQTNWRSCTPLVQGVNGLFQRAKAPFVFDEDIVFYPVSAAGEADREPLRIDGELPSPLQAWLVERTQENLWRGVITKGWAEPRIARACAVEIAGLLALGAAGRATLEGRALAARDIAILVRSHFEARSVQQALRSVEIASVYYSRDSVYASAEAEELARVLHAVAEPGNERLLRAALCTELLGVGAAELDELTQNEGSWEEWLQRVQRYHGFWQRQGFMSMFRRLLHEQDVPRRVLSGMDGERRLTNLLQLGELLLVASQEHEGIEPLMRWFAAQRAAPDGDSDDQQLRLESDEDLVKIVTIHKSKGLEYPVVFLPFIWASRPLAADGPILFHDEATRTLRLDLGSPEAEAHRALARRERLAEDLRLLYVALTRARYRCYCSWGLFNGAAESALAYLLHPPTDETRGAGQISIMASLTDDEIRSGLESVSSAEPVLLEVTTPPIGDAEQADRHPAAEQPEPFEAMLFRGRIDASWLVTSYSALAADHSGHVEAPDHDALEPESQMETAVPVSLERTIYQFPRGAQAGSFMHAVFERLDFPAAHGEILGQEVDRQLDRCGYEREWRPVIEQMVGRVLDTPLDPHQGLRLRDLDEGRKRVEMEFYYPLSMLRAGELNGVLRGFEAYRSRAPSLDFNPLRGMMKGYIDLVFEDRGRFYLADYKSNHLGDEAAAYGPAQIQDAMHAHRYHLQYLIYTVALHRYLRLRIPAYDYEQHFGGAYYLFLRGMAPDMGPGQGVFFDKPERSVIEALDELFAGNRAAAR